jgi:N-acetylated-alpha-linked acidic dipeptidase
MPGDDTSTNTGTRCRPMSPSRATATSPPTLVYVNYGMPEDYEALERRGIDVKGKIVIARYGGGWRGLKPKLAQEHGAIGCIIYSDPRRTAMATTTSIPRAARPRTAFQRGSVADMTVYPGDPLTPGVGATADAKRLTAPTPRPS